MMNNFVTHSHKKMKTAAGSSKRVRDLMMVSPRPRCYGQVKGMYEYQILAGSSR